MNNITLRLITEQPNYDLNLITEETKNNIKKSGFEGKFLMLNRRNKNNRVYEEKEMVPAIQIFEDDYIKPGRAGGELGHSNSPDMDLNKLCHKIISLERDKHDPDFYNGKSIILSTPSGKVVQSLFDDGIKLGVSSKILGTIVEGTEQSIVKNPIVLGIDIVWDPSIGNISGNSGFVKGILENKEYIISDNGKVAESYNKLEKKLAKYPGKHREAINAHITESFREFLKSI